MGSRHSYENRIQAAENNLALLKKEKDNQEKIHNQRMEEIFKEMRENEEKLKEIEKKGN
jgi:hypothetical protein